MDFDISHLYLKISDNNDILGQQEYFKLFLSDKNDTL